MKPLHTPIWFLAYWNGLPMLDFRRLGGFVRYASAGVAAAESDAFGLALVFIEISQSRDTILGRIEQ